MPNFTPGTSDPAVTPDKGAGPWGAELPTPDTLAFKAAFNQLWPQAIVVIGDDGRETHGLLPELSGFRYRIDLAGMVAESPKAKKIYDDELLHAQLHAARLPVGRHQFTSACSRGATTNSKTCRQINNLFRGTPFAVTVTDTFRGKMHRQGLARESDCWGLIRQNYV